MSSIYANPNGLTSRKGNALLTRFKTTLPFESTIEERLIRVLDADLDIVTVKRAETVKVFSFDGSSHEYTADFEVSLINQQTYVLECKPQNLLHDILVEDLSKWTARAMLLKQQDKPLHIITDDDLPDSLIQKSISYTPFFNTFPYPDVEKTAMEFLQERGYLPLSTLRLHIRSITQRSFPEIDSTLYGLIARNELIANESNFSPNCLVDLPNRHLEPTRTPLGKLVQALLIDLPKPTPRLEPKMNPALILEQKFLATGRGQKALELFSVYNNPNVPITKQLAKELTQKIGVNARTLFRFRLSLIEAGAPNIIFTELVPFLTGATPIRPKRQVEDKVATIIEEFCLKNYFVPVGSPTNHRASTMAELHEMIRKACLQKELSPPAYTTVKRFVEKIIKRDPIKATKARDGQEKADSLEARQGKLIVLRYGEVIAVDCSPCDVFFQKSKAELHFKIHSRGKNQRKENATRGNFVTVADIATGQVLRSVIFESGIGGAEILEVLRDVFLRDQKLFSQNDIVSIPQGFGLPQRIRLDSGSEFTNKQVARVLAHLGIERVTRNSYTKHYGGREERIIGILSHSHHVLVGTTMNTIEKRGVYQAQANAVLDFADLNRFHQKNVERYNNLHAPLHEYTRHQHAQHLVDNGVTAWRILSQSQLDYVTNRMHPEEDRLTIQKGISMFGLKYQSDALRPLIIRRAKLNISYNPDDICVVNAIHPDTGERIPLTAELPEGFEPPISKKLWYEYRHRVRKAARQAQDAVETPQEIVADVMAKKTERTIEQKKSKSRHRSVQTSPSQSRKIVETGARTIQSAVIEFLDNPVEIEE